MEIVVFGLMIRRRTGDGVVVVVAMVVAMVVVMDVDGNGVV